MVFFSSFGSAKRPRFRFNLEKFKFRPHCLFSFYSFRMNPFPIVWLSFCFFFSFASIFDTWMIIVHKREVNTDPNAGKKIANVNARPKIYSYVGKQSGKRIYTSLLCACLCECVFQRFQFQFLLLFSPFDRVFCHIAFLFRAFLLQLFHLLRLFSHPLYLSLSCHCHSKQYWCEQRHEIAIANHGKSSEKCNLRIKTAWMIGWNVYQKNVQIEWKKKSAPMIRKMIYHLNHIVLVVLLTLEKKAFFRNAKMERTALLQHLCGVNYVPKKWSFFSMWKHSHDMQSSISS